MSSWQAHQELDRKGAPHGSKCAAVACLANLLSSVNPAAGRAAPALASTCPRYPLSGNIIEINDVC